MIATIGYIAPEFFKFPGYLAPHLNLKFSEVPNGGTLGVPNAGGPIENEEARRRKLNAELANGQLAMMAIIGMFFQDGLTGSAYGDWALYTGSPLRAFENELGVQPPMGYWDPMGIGAVHWVSAESIRKRTWGATSSGILG